MAGCNELLAYGQWCVGQGYEDLAEVLITSAHNMDGSTATKEGLSDIRERLVKRWHFLMLNDLARHSLVLLSML